MATVDVRRAHTLTVDEAKRRAEQIAVSIAQKVDLAWRWQGDCILFEAPRGVAKGSKGTISVSNTDVHVEIDLPLMLRPLKGKVEAKVNEKLDLLR